MNVSEFTCISLGMLFNVLTFFLGVAVGVNVCQQKRKDSHNGNRYEDEGFQYFDDGQGHAAARSGGLRESNGRR